MNSPFFLIGFLLLNASNIQIIMYEMNSQRLEPTKSRKSSELFQKGSKALVPQLNTQQQTSVQAKVESSSKAAFRQKLRALKRKKDRFKKAICSGPKRIVRKYLGRNRKLHERRDYWREEIEEMQESFVESEKGGIDDTASKLKNQEQFICDQDSSFHLASSNNQKLIPKHPYKLSANQSILLPLQQGNKLYFTVIRRNKLLYPEFNLIDKNNHPIIFCKKTSFLAFSFSLREGDWDEASESYIGRLVSNISGSVLNLFVKTGPEEQKLICSVEYTNSVLDFKKPRTIKVYLLDLIKKRGSFPKVGSLSQLYMKEKQQSSGIWMIQNKLPVYTNKGYSLDFHGRAPVSSIKNFIMQSPRWKGKEFLLFGKKGDNQYNIDLMHPFSVICAFAVVVSNFNGKLVCE